MTINNGYDFTDEIAYVVERANAEGSIPRYLETEYKNERSINELVSEIVILYEKILGSEIEGYSGSSDDDANEYIAKKTGYSIEIIVLALWFYECFLMENDRIVYCNVCLNCGHDVLYIREDRDDMFFSYIECGKCKTIFGFEEFLEDDDDFFESYPDEGFRFRRDVNDTNKSYIIKAATGYRNGIWRKIRISAAATLDDLSDAILTAFDFDDDHLYAFYMDQKLRKRGVPTYYSPQCGGGSSRADRCMLEEFGFQPKQKFLYLYDFGDEWHFVMTFEKEIDEATPTAFVVASKGEAPAQYWCEEDEYDEYDERDDDDD